MRPSRFTRPLTALLATIFFGSGLLLAGAGESAAVPESFAAARDVLERRCLECHGGGGREGGLSFADATTFRSGGSRGSVIDDGEPAASRLLSVIRYDNPDLAMPPTGVLPDADRAVLERWILDGAPWPESAAGRLADPELHPLPEGEGAAVGPWWAYDPLTSPPVPRPEVPEGVDSAWAEHPVDAFVLDKLVAAGLEPAEHAEPEHLLRRASFDLTGLPPTREERRAFLDDVTARGFDAAWSSLLDALFASPHYGESQARHWLDLVRYAETNGYERDARKRNIWRYRDWVVRAFDADLPYDAFGRLQLAGDELAPELDDGADRASALLATGFYRLGVWDDEPADRQQARSDERADIVDTVAQVFMGTTMGCARCHDHKADPVTQAEYFQLTSSFAGMVGYGGAQTLEGGGTRHVPDPTDLARTRSERDLEALDGRLREAVAALPAVEVPVERLLADARTAPAEWSYRVEPPADGEAEDWTAPAFDDDAWARGPGGFGTAGTPGAVIGTEWSTDRIRMRATFRLAAIPEALRLELHHDEDVDVYFNGRRVLSREGYRSDYGAFQLPGRALGALVVGRNVLALDCRQSVGGQFVDAGLVTGLDPAADGWALARAEFALRRAEGGEELASLVAERAALLALPLAEDFPAQLALERGPEPPAQFIELRGSVHAPGDEVGPGLPEAWRFGSSSPEGLAAAVPTAASSGRRRAFADWLFDGGAHLSARVEANRTWQFLLGRGLCRTSGDFGRLGEAPTHPELLDHLASTLIEGGWSRKALQRYLMESRSYRMSVAGDPAGLMRDPRNDLYWRFPPRRLTAEEFRDATLAASGELNRERFGPSVFPPLPAAVLATSSTPDSAWGSATPEAAARRSLYVHVKRSLREPLLAALDQPDPDLPCPERFPTNVPTQALLTLNGEFTNARAAALADRVAAESDGDPERIALAIQRALARDPQEGEVQRGLELLDRLESEAGLDRERALELFALGLFNRNEFLWLD